MKKIDQDIKNNKFENIYLLYGNESYLIRSYKNMLIDAISGGDSMNVSKYEGDRIDIESLIEDINMAPFFADYRLIVVEDSKLFKKSSDDLADALGAVPESTIIIFAESQLNKEGKPEIDKRNRMYKGVAKHGYVCEMNTLSSTELFKWAARRINHENKKITADTLEYLLSLTDGSMHMVKNDIDKVISYIGDGEVINVSDVDAVCSRPIVGKIFEMTDAMSVKNKEKCLSLYNDLIASKEAPSQILYMLSRQFYLLLAIKELSDKGMYQKAIADELKLNPYVVKNCLTQCRNFEKKTLMKAFRESVRMSRRARSGLLNEMIAIEMLLIKYSE